MKLLTPEQTAALRDWFLPEQPGPLVGLHMIQTGNGSCFTDRWPDPRAVLVVSAGNYSLSGEVGAVTSDGLRPLIRGFVETSLTFVPLLKAAFPEVKVWNRVILEKPPSAHPSSLTGRQQTRNLKVRPLKPDDAQALQRLSSETAWITKTWGDAQGLASSGRAWGAVMDGRIASVACTFFCGEKYEDIGVVTEAEFRGEGLSTACAAALCGDIESRGCGRAGRLRRTISPAYASRRSSGLRFSAMTGFMWWESPYRNHKI